MNPGEPRVLIIMPARNEAANIVQCLESFVSQTRPPDTLLVVDDSSSDNTAALVREFMKEHPWIQMVSHGSVPMHQPGAKVVEAFRAGLPPDWESFEYIGKFDADIVLPPTYFEAILEAFRSNPALGICSGLLYTLQQGEWIYEPIANKDHVRGPVKFYSAYCFKAIGGLRAAIGWDTADVLLARYHGYQVLTIESLSVKHLRPTGSGYSAQNARLQGRALYNLRYGWYLSLIAAIKMAFKRKNPLLPWHAMLAYSRAYLEKEPRMLTPEEGRFARDWRWKNIKSRLPEHLRNRASGSPIRESNP